MNKGISVALLAGGVVLLIIGISAAQSLSSSISKFFTGSPTDKAVWMLIIGTVLCIVGLVGVLGGSKGS